MSTKLEKIFNGINTDCYIIAEIGNNFNGDMEIAKESIRTAALCGADAVKFQTYKAEEFVANSDLKYTYKDTKGKSITESQFEMFKRLELKDEWHKDLMMFSNQQKLDFFSSAADVSAVDLLISLNVPAIKLASEDLINIKLLDYLASKNYPVILSTGMADKFEIQNAIKIFEKYGSDQIIILHCVSQYPTPSNRVNLKRISALKKYFAYPVGYSDHSLGWEAPMQSIAYGVKVIEKHFTLDRNMQGPDHQMASDPKDFKKVVEMIRLAEQMSGKETLNYGEGEKKARIEFRRSIVANQNIPKGTVINKDMIAFKRPGNGLKPYEIDKILGKKAKENIKANSYIDINNVSN